MGNKQQEITSYLQQTANVSSVVCFVCFFVSLSGVKQKTYQIDQILMKLGGRMLNRPRRNSFIFSEWIRVTTWIY